MMAAACKYFEEDAVYRINKKGQLEYGLILENSEFISSDEEDNVDIKNDEWEPMKKGHVRIAWHPRGHEEVLPERKVFLADRSLMPGDVVRRVIKGKDTQRGYCRSVEVKASVQVVGTRQVIDDIKSSDLVPLEDFTVDIAIFLDSWVGMIKVVKSRVHLRCCDGSRCIISDNAACDLDDLLDKRERGSEFRKYDFYPGQQLWGPVRCFEDAEWIHTTEEMKSLLQKPHKILRVTVESLKVQSIGVHWQCRAFSKGSKLGADPEQPKFVIQGEDLKRVKILNIFEPCTLQLGDRNYYIFKDGDALLTKEQWRKLQRETKGNDRTNASSKEDNGPKANKNNSTDLSDSTTIKTNLNENDAIENDSEFEDVDTDDGNTSDSTSISSKSSTSSASQAFNKGKKAKKGSGALATKILNLKKKKLKRARKKIHLEIISAKPGDKVVVETLSTTSKAQVVWQDSSMEDEVLSTDLYPIHHLDEQEFFPGDFVIENRENLDPHEYGVVKTVDHSGRTTVVHWMKTYTESSEPHPVFLHEQEVSVYDLKDHPDFKYRPGSVVIRVANFEDESTESTAGQVLDVYPSGMVKVHWVSGKQSFCYPQELYKVGEYDSDEGELWDDGDSDDSWETESEQSIIADESNNDISEPNAPTNRIPGQDEEQMVLKPKLAANIERARTAMARLEEIFTQNPALQTGSVMRQLLDVYRDCKYLDRLMGTSFFHERHFHGLLERVRERGRTNSSQRVVEQVSRLFKKSESAVDLKKDDKSNSEKNSSDQSSTNISVAGGGGGASSGSSEEDSNKTSHICARLCSLLKGQLLRAHEEVVRLFGKQIQPEDINGETSPETTAVLEKNSKKVDTASIIDKTGDLSYVTRDETTQTVDNPDETTQTASNSTNMTKYNHETKDVKEDEQIESTSNQAFTLFDTVPDSHKFKLTMLEPSDPKSFFRGVKKELKLLKTSLPEGIIVKGFEERLDLYSVMIKGPARTPYEDGLFFFDFQLSPDYPKSPPICYYISYCSDRLNPNLYEDGKVCISLLGTWGGKGTEVWTSNSNLLQVIVSIQGLILVSEPYFNEAGYERQKGTQQGRENSRMYNEMVMLKLVQAMTKIVINPPEIFKVEITDHFQQNAFKLIHRLEKWLEISENYNKAHPFTPTTPTGFKDLHGKDFENANNVNLPEFPLIPASKGFCITLRKTLLNLKDVLASVGIFDVSRGSGS